MNDGIRFETKRGVEPVVRLVGTEEDVAPAQLSNDKPGGSVAEAAEWISSA
jgi:hypothetical protein